jgi:succinyl-diaminopimelate desuccinylase
VADSGNEIVELASRLIARVSITPDDAGCQALISEELTAQGFTLTELPCGDVNNLWAVRGQGAPMLVLAGHTDVVPTGPENAWRFPPFRPTLADGCLYGRGSADMKGSLAAMLISTRRFLAEHPDHGGSIAYLITSDEEGPAVHGTVKVVDWLADQDIRPDYCVVGEPSSAEIVGDVIRIGRRGSLNGRLTLHGIQGHVAYPDQAANPIHQALAPFAELTARTWDEGNDAFPPTTFQISNINSGTGATNVIPGTLTALFNFRYSTEQTASGLMAQVEQLLDRHGIKYSLDWEPSGTPFQTATPELIELVRQSVQAVQSIEPEASTGGGTSDGRFIARLGTEIVELGPVNATIHSVDEHVRIDDLTALADIYQEILNRVLPANA